MNNPPTWKERCEDFLDMRELSPLPNPAQLRRWASSQLRHAEQHGTFPSSAWIPKRDSYYR